MAMRRWVRTFKRRFGISRSGVPLAEPVSADHVQAKAGPGSNFWDFFWPLGRRILLETTQILEPFWFFFWGREPHQVTTFYRWPDYLAAPVWPEKSILWLSADETNLSRVGLRRRWGTLSPRGGGLQYVSICSSFCRVATAEMAMRRWVRTFKRRFGISRSGVPLAEPVSADHVQAKAGPGSNFWDFFWPLGRRILLETTQILEPFWFFFGAGNRTR